MTFENIKTKINEVLPTSISGEQKSAGGETFRPFASDECPQRCFQVFRRRGFYFIDYSNSKAPV